MDLREYLESLSVAEKAAFALRCGTSLDYLWQLAGGIRTPKVQLAIAISRESDGKVTCESLIPDADWNYLRQQAAAAQAGAQA